MNVWLAGLVTLLQQEENLRYSSNLPNTRGGALLSGKDVEVQTGQKHFIVRSGQSLEYVYVVIGAVRSYPYVLRGRILT